MTEDETDLNPFDVFKRTADVMAFCYAAFGEDGLRELLAQMDSARESLERDAAELQDLGLPKVAAIVMEYAADALPEPELMCPYSPEDRANYECWQASYDKRQWMNQNPGPYSQKRPGN